MEQKTALLVMDMQVGIVSMLADAKTILSNVAKAVAAARSKNIPVIFVVVGFRTGAPEISENNRMFAASKARMTGGNPEEFMKVHPDLQPAANELVVVKRRVSAFTGSDLEVILRAQQINHLVLTGIATSGVVLSTVREAADKDFALTVLADGCADHDEEVHRVLTAKVFARQADVLTVDEWSK
jgi:nicotinamidase-related amidase